MKRSVRSRCLATTAAAECASSQNPFGVHLPILVGYTVTLHHVHTEYTAS
ncbi:hypothetical protein WMW72_31085 [Paenibacillus filicis]|uniref:Uncharacterized protein n=1 Tax=Paenibacillus filicis TaxID=669464 RepID=A0ABU9DU00_9BACL